MFHSISVKSPKNPPFFPPAITLKIDNPLFLVSSILEDISFDSQKVISEILTGPWCQTLKTYDFPISDDDDDYLLNQPIERLCQRWRYCRDNLLSLISCKALRTEKVYSVSMKRSFRFYDEKYVCDSDVNNLSCLQQHCECDLEFSKQLMNMVVDDAKYEKRYKLETKTLIDGKGREVNVTVHK